MSRTGTDGTYRCLNILRLDGGRDLAGRQAQLGHLIRTQVNPHRILGTVSRNIGHALDTLNRIHEVGQGVRF